MLNMFQTLIHPSSQACVFSIISPHWLCVGVSVWLVGVVSVWQASACNTDTMDTMKQEHATNVVIQLKSRRLLMMYVLMSETC